jgi:hypothetical protein
VRCLQTAWGCCLWCWGGCSFDTGKRDTETVAAESFTCESRS